MRSRLVICRIFLSALVRFCNLNVNRTSICARFSSTVSVVGAGGGGDNGGRGGNTVRGRIRIDTLQTKPATITSKKGQSGTPINLMANYFPLVQAGKWCLYQYRVDFAPEIDVISAKKKLMREAIKDVIRGDGYLFDGTVLYSPQRLMPDPMELFAADENAQNIRLTIRLVGDLAWGDAHYVQLFNIIVRKCLVLMGLQMVGRNYYSPSNKIMINEHKIQLWPGYITSMRQHEQNILLNVDLQFKFMRTDNVLDLLNECRGGNMRKDFQTKIIGSVVLTYYNNKTYRIDDVDFNCTPNDTFQLGDGSQISYMDYFKRKYNVNVRVPQQPMLVSRSKPREIRAGMPETVYLVPELCQLTGLSEQQRNNFHLMRTLADHTRVGVDGRVRKLMEFSRILQSKPEVVQEIRRWDLNIAQNLVQFQGRVLNPETILSGQEGKSVVGQGADWTKDVRSKPMFYAARMNSLVVITPYKLKNATYDFMRLTERAASGMRWDIGRPRVIDISDDRTSTYLEQIERAINSYTPTLLMIVLPNNTQDRYSAIKKKLVVDRGIPSQLIVGKNLTAKGAMSIATKVAIQMNCKIGGSPWSVIMPISNIMIVGYDVCRDTANKRKCFAGMVSSLDKQMTRYYSNVCEHSLEEEISDQFASFLVLACQAYKRNQGGFPDRILIFRDAVGDGQIPYVYNHEVVSIKNKLMEQVYKTAPLKLAFVIVSKRINTRIFRDQQNPPPGTVVDDVITLPERYDYYIVSQCVRQGTVSPTSFNVLEDTMGLPPDRMQILTYKMCHLYFNWSGTVRVPAPCQYAHKLSFLTAQSLHRPAHQDLQNVLYYL